MRSALLFGTGGFSPSLPDGFPNPSPDQISKIQDRARGTLPNTPLPSGLSKEGITNFKLIAFNELFEVAFFYELVHNITNNVKGYQFGESKDQVLEDLNVILAVEELHALGANAILQTNHVDPIKSCKYNFPVSDFESAIGLAATFTDVVLGTLQDVNDIFAQNTESGPVRLISSVIGNEGQQEGLFRIIQKKTTPAQPFLTTGTRDFAFTAIQSFVVPGSCPNIEDIPLTTFKPLKVLTQNIQPKDQELEFSIDISDVDIDVNSLSLVLINAQNAPIVKTLENIETKNGVVTFRAEFPFEKFLLHGLTIAAVTHSAESFANADDVAKQTVFAPGLIEVN
ncbi:late sexual development protein [Karstenula rhodostoma CBS 690.94]|uniref:Late sexual development protein n=1 Tax=Karstenula rhodostoma CBS 690.94 TaxID=1392251 RepID=A0A9P4PDM9_9PLEO|nr:late sexual development protein [Karstenula rhodostoma CBS 690.94]